MGRGGLVSEFMWDIVDYYQQKVSVPVASQVAEQLTTEKLRKLGNFNKAPGMLEPDGEYLAGHPKANNRRFC